ncbi:kelch domain-containing protein 10 homolog isoform X2 [Microplitis mediator]|uniref:kelch domain-containing protein 10 homolog isoform X2 n=1 Tax=Microplitis mediator TaxID=375433 RepID=UPI0025579557|nr:kelch domain-containing protein 10 homolog isoform X2 [Microplitis mediator]
MYKFKTFSLIKRDSLRYPVVSNGILFITSDNSNIYTYDGKCPGIWSYNLSLNQWNILMRLNNYLRPWSEDDIIGIVKENNLIKIFSINDTSGEAKTRLHICNLTTKKVDVQNLNGFIPRTVFVSRKNIIYYDNCYYTAVCVTPDDNGYAETDIYRLNIDSFTWECVYKSSGLDPHQPLVESAIALIYNEKKIYFFHSLTMYKLVSTFDLDTYHWDTLQTIGDDRNHGGPFHPPWRSSFSMTEYVDPDSNDTCLLVSGGEDLMTFNADTDIWKLNLSTLTWRCLGNFGNLSYQCFLRRWACVTPNGRLLTCDESSDNRINRFTLLGQESRSLLTFAGMLCSIITQT